MIAMGYPARFSPDEDGRPVVHFSDLPEAMTDGKDMREAFEEAQDCLGSALAHRLASKQDIPRPSRLKKGDRLVPVPLWIASKVALHWAMRARHVNNSQLARMLGVRETVIRRMLDPDRATKSEKLQAALEALGKRLLVAVQDAA